MKEKKPEEIGKEVETMCNAWGVALPDGSSLSEVVATVIRAERASRVEVPSEEKIKEAALFWCKDHQFSEKDRGHAFFDGAKWALAQIERIGDGK